ncbi:site-specific integrase [Brevibacillus choshinensis]|uniref:Site-specific integrase n=1 Tax=Brevibacillus choshinensis TaxID=54911 RepID=A0ABX7FQ29_BRECH|nr:site-specific integrase [Brevibacillus choshinensis]QRG67402.1 site-specific integrase [Brevibacillus choshinensis]
MTLLSVNPVSEYYSELLEKLDINLLHLQDARGMFLLDKVEERNIKHIMNNVIDMPWCNHFLFAILVQADRNLDPKTIDVQLNTLQPRMKDLFHFYSIQEMRDFIVDVHMYGYLKGECYPEHSCNMRRVFLQAFRSLAYHTKKWLTQKLNQEQQAYFEQFLFPMPSFDTRDFSFGKLAVEQAQNNRKNETDAIVPYLPEIRATARFRWSQTKRLRDAFYKAIDEAKKRPNCLPLEFHYDEPERIGERLYFRLWDKRSFVLHHEEQFHGSVVELATNRKGTYSDENNHFFVELVKAELLDNDEEADGLWFTEIIQEGVLGYWSQNASEEELERKRIVLNSWGYGEEESEKNPIPFRSQHKGVLFQSTFVTVHKGKAKGVLFDVEPFYVACTFGLLAIDVFTITGARINELLQINNTKECIQVKKVKDKLHYSFRAIPKGRDELEEFYINKQTMEYIQIVLRMLKDHYQSDTIPSVEYRHDRKHLLPEPKPYYFQYHNMALNKFGVSACIRFLLHAIRFETQEGIPVTVKSHLLRHAFATEAVQRQKMPIDIVAKILHQRDVNVTGYYSAPTPTQVAQAIGELHEVIASYVDIDEAIIRSPEELQKELEEHNSKVGVFNKVLGGTCVTDYVCPTKMACLGCKAKIPEPEQEPELHEVIELSKDMEKRFAKMGLDVEVNKAKEMRKQARIELKEIELIKQYREERKFEPNIHFYK